LMEHRHEGHRARLRERFEATGAEGFSDHELLELILTYVIVQKDTNDLAHLLIDSFGSLQGVLDAEKEELARIEGVGPKAAFLLKLLPAFSRRYYEQKTESRLKLITPDETIPFFAARMIDRENECVYAAYLDQNKRLIQCSLLYEGNAHMVEISTGRLLKTALRLNSRYVVLAHNHFNHALPSVQDVAATTFIQKKLKEVGITLLDHIVLCGSEGSSMIKTGHLTLEE